MTDAAAPIAEIAPPPRPFALPLPGVWVYLACLILALFCNAGGLRGQGFIGAEKVLVANNDLLNRLPGLQSIWFRASDPASYPLPQYAPLAQSMFFFEHAIWGDTLWAYRLVSVLLHALVGLMIWRLLRGLAVPGALVVALLFVAHPMTVDSVSWIAERRNPLAAFLGLSSAFLLLRASGVILPADGKLKLLPDDPVRLFGLGAILFVLGLCSNATIATLPLVVLLIAWWKRPASQAKADVRLVGTCVALLVAGVGMLSLSSSIEKARAGVASPAAWNRASTDAAELAVRTQVAGRAVVFYAQKLLVPFPISIDYPRWQTPRDVEQFRTFTTEPDRANSRTPDVAPGNVLMYAFPLAVIAAAIASWRLRTRFGTGQFVLVAGFVLLLAPSLGFIDLGWMRYSFVANRAAYVASIPFLVGVVVLIGALVAMAEDRTITISSAAIGIALCAILSLFVSQRFRNVPYFWVQNARAYPTFRSWWPRYELAASLLNEPDPAAEKQAKQAIQDVRRSRPDEPAALVLQGLYKQRDGDEIGAVADFDACMQTFPGYGPAYFEAADSFRVQADKRPTDPKPRLTAFQLFEEAAARDPFDARSRVRLGITAWDVARRMDPADPALPKFIDRAAEAFDQAVQLRPYDVDLLVQVARTLVDMRKLSDAGGLLESARSIDPDRADVYVVIGDAALAAGDAVGADAAFRTAITLAPERVEARLRLGMLRQAQERWGDAREIFRDVLTVDPENRDARRLLAEVDTAATTRPEASTTRPQ